ncbi:uroporphyrinogen-III synthase [Filimonas lacunae]|uniref:Uroporphyrinogen-III synthase n=1 Tax=Filimonas lacunae TaxID=477680 RepID=A0A173MN16_9BACT|nr:uroporphyrinogen-III synthase [Filimonas lacunae]BAV09045.1 uroporphyrinogen-III synthase, divergent, Flavobacterial type [Filimonas lacunae]SIS66361.1 uroporphyrinogen-III synthase [Filimonas lacunae]
MQGTKANILCTRSLEGPHVQKAVDHGLHLVTVPFIHTEAIHTPELQARVQEIAAQPATVVFTSIKAVEAVLPLLPATPQWRIYCLGGVTKELLVQHFGEAAIAGASKNATSLAEKILKASPLPQEVFFFCGDQRMDDLPQLLQQHNIAVQEIIAYTTQQTPHTIEVSYDGILFFSPSAVHSFFSTNTIHTDVVLFAIGKTTAATIHSYVCNKIVTSEWPGQEHMIDLVIDYFK